MGLELHDRARYGKAFWPEATTIVQPEPGNSFTMPYQAAAERPKPPAGGAPMTNVIGNELPPWHLALSHHFEFQSPTRATHYGYVASGATGFWAIATIKSLGAPANFGNELGIGGDFDFPPARYPAGIVDQLRPV